MPTPCVPIYRGDARPGIRESNPLKFIGLIPAAGHATRLGPELVGSKELIPIGTPSSPARPVCEYLLLQMQRAGIDRALIVVREDKRDIPERIGDGRDLGLRIEYVTTGATAGVPYTLDRAYSRIRDATVVLGFPDILVAEEDCFARLVRRYRSRPVDVLLGLFPRGDAAMDAVELDGERVCRVIPKPPATAHAHAWGCAIWGNTFSDFLHATLRRYDANTPPRELYVGDLLQAAVSNGITVEGAPVSAHPFLDIGTPDGLRAARQRALPPR